MNRGTLTTKALLFLSFVLTTAIPQIGFAQSTSAGTWKLNLAKSKFSPRPTAEGLHLNVSSGGTKFNGHY